MTRTTAEAATCMVSIGLDAPFCVIGERINPTGRKKLAAEMEQGIFPQWRVTRWSRLPADIAATS